MVGLPRWAGSVVCVWGVCLLEGGLGAWGPWYPCRPVSSGLRYPLVMAPPGTWVWRNSELKSDKRGGEHLEDQYSHPGLLVVEWPWQVKSIHCGSYYAHARNAPPLPYKQYLSVDVVFNMLGRWGAKNKPARPDEIKYQIWNNSSYWSPLASIIREPLGTGC